MTREQFQNAVWGMYGNNTISHAWELYKRSQHALWMARADRALMTLEYFTIKCRWFEDFMKTEPPTCDVQMIQKWQWVERKCREKAKEFWRGE